MPNFMVSEAISVLKPFVSDSRLEHFNRIIPMRTRKLTLVLEDLYDPHNANAVIRSCDCFGIQDIHLIENRNPFTPSSNVTQGALKWLTVHRHSALAGPSKSQATVEHLQARGYTVLATTPHTDKTPEDYSFHKPIAIVMGNEKEGISPQVAETADGLVKIPMLGFTESFNISVAAALFLQVFRNKLEKEFPQSYGLTKEEQHILELEWMMKSIKLPELILKNQGIDPDALPL